LERQAALLKVKLEHTLKAWKAKAIRDKEEIKQKKQEKK
jgi:hypothetical protein